MTNTANTHETEFVSGDTHELCILRTEHSEESIMEFINSHIKSSDIPNDPQLLFFAKIIEYYDKNEGRNRTTPLAMVIIPKSAFQSMVSYGYTKTDNPQVWYDRPVSLNRYFIKQSDIPDPAKYVQRVLMVSVPTEYRDKFVTANFIIDPDKRKEFYCVSHIKFVLKKLEYAGWITPEQYTVVPTLESRIGPGKIGNQGIRIQFKESVSINTMVVVRNWLHGYFWDPRLRNVIRASWPVIATVRREEKKEKVKEKKTIIKKETK